MSSNHINIKYYNSPIGELIIGAFGNQLCLCDWRYRKMRNSIDNRIQTFFKADYTEGDSPVIAETITALEAYFSENQFAFDIPLALAGSDFQIKVWQSLLEIPYGQTQTYLGLSRQLGNEKAIRAVASANGANAISIIVPCHRIIGSDGSLTGYAGGLPAKKQLLKLEGALIEDQLSLF